jgi:membrane protease YdiL (CAAX protease family)
MDNTTLQILMWLPALILSLIGVMWYFSFPSKQRKNHNLEAFGLVALGIVISTVIWSFWLIYDIKGADEMKVAFADKVIMGIMIGTFGSLTAIAVLTVRSTFSKDDRVKKGKKGKKKR